MHPDCCPTCWHRAFQRLRPDAALQIAWADDLSILADFASATLAVERIPHLARLVLKILEAFRFRVNLGPEPVLDLEDGRALREVPEYKYLGVPQRAKDRLRQAEAMLSGLNQASGLIHSPVLPWQLKLVWLQGRTLPAAYSSLATTVAKPWASLGAPSPADAHDACACGAHHEVTAAGGSSIIEFAGAAPRRPKTCPNATRNACAFRSHSPANFEFPRPCRRPRRGAHHEHQRDPRDAAEEGRRQWRASLKGFAFTASPSSGGPRPRPQKGPAALPDFFLRSSPGPDQVRTCVRSRHRENGDSDRFSPCTFDCRFLTSDASRTGCRGAR